MNKVKVTMVEKRGKCPHNVGDSFEFGGFRTVEGMCIAAANAIYPALSGMIFAGGDARQVSCPSKKGTVWEVKVV